MKNKQIKRIKTEAGEIIFKVHVKQKPERGLIKQVVLQELHKNRTRIVQEFYKNSTRIV